MDGARRVRAPATEYGLQRECRGYADNQSQTRARRQEFRSRIRDVAVPGTLKVLPSVVVLELRPGQAEMLAHSDNLGLGPRSCTPLESPDWTCQPGSGWDRPNK